MALEGGWERWAEGLAGRSPVRHHTWLQPHEGPEEGSLINLLRDVERVTGPQFPHL